MGLTHLRNLWKLSEQTIYKSPRIIARARVDDEASLLIDDDDVVVRMNDRHRHPWVWIRQFFTWDLGRVDRHLLAFRQPQFATGFHYSVDKHSSTFDKIGGNRPRHVKNECDDSVNSLAVERTRNYLNQHRLLPGRPSASAI
jgi:hypothetical protein